MSTTTTFHNESINFQLTGNASTTPEVRQFNGYCTLPALHSHARVQVPGELWNLFATKSNETNGEGEEQDENDADDDDDNNDEEDAGEQEKKSDGRLQREQSMNAPHRQQQLDPYIDAVQVKSRKSPNKRGMRVKAAQVIVHAADHKPDSSYYSKTVHVEHAGGSSKDWHYSDDSDDSDYSDDDDSDDYEHDKHHDVTGHHKHHGGGGHKNYKNSYIKKKRPKKVYGVKKVHVGAKKTKRRRRRRKSYKKKKGHGGKKYYAGKGKHEPEKKVIYIKYKEPGKYHEHDYHGKSYDHHGKSYDQHYGKSHDYGKNHHDHGKIVHLSVGGGGGKGKMSLAGILGQTLLCVNYLLVLKQPQYDKHSHHYYTKYAPHGGHGDTVQLKSHGPIILAHCGQLPDARSLVHLKRTYDEQDIAASNTSSSSRMFNSTRLLQAAEQQRTVYGTHSPASVAPPSYYYTLAPTSQQDAPGFSLASPIQNFLNRLFLPRESALTSQPTDGDSEAPVRVLSGPPRRRLPASGPLRLSDDARALITRTGSGGRVILIDGQPRVVQTRDNLVDMRTRQVEIRLRVTDGPRLLGLPQRALRLNSPLTNQAAGNFRLPAGLAVRAPDQMVQNDAPEVPVNNQQQQQQLGLDLPEYALSGDSIELTCNHRTPSARLYSVKWFKDSLEFYRFVPAQFPAKSSLFLANVELDLERSNSQSLHLRNVSHLTSGVYRCEVISEAPEFELLSGERRLQVYALPATGPRLNLLERADEMPTLTTTIASNGRLQTTVTRLNSAQFNNDADDDDDDPNDQQLDPSGRRAQAQRLAAGPMIRCSSDRSKPAAQLRFFVNNRPVELRRTMENATISYSDGLDSNVVSFRVQLTDFVIDEQFARQLEGRATLDKAAASSSKLSSGRNSTTTSSTTTSTTSTTTTTSTTKRPSVESKKKVLPVAAAAAAKTKHNPNAQVHFDDHKSDGVVVEKKQARRKSSKMNSTKMKQPPRGEQQRSLLENDVYGPDTTDERTPLANELAPLPAADKPPSAEISATAAAAHRVVRDLAALKRQEQRVLVTSQLAGGARGEREGERQARIYSNFVRVKCVSSVPTLGYEMISELSLPLTLLVPASQLDAALRGQSSQSTASSAAGSGAENRQTTGTDDERRPRARNGVGSLQAPRTVSVDRMAQASGGQLFYQQLNRTEAFEQQRRRRERTRAENNTLTVATSGGATSIDGIRFKLFTISLLTINLIMAAQPI